MHALQKEIRIVIPFYRSKLTITDCLDAVVKATAFSCSCEIVVVDNEEAPELLKLPDNYPVRVIKRNKITGAAYARNEGAEGFENGILVFIDSDVICEEGCIPELIKPIQMGSCHATIGNYSKNLDGLTFSQKYKQLYINHIYDRVGTEIKNDFWTAIASVDAGVFKKLKGFNSNFRGANGEDQEFGIRLTKNNFQVVSVKTAKGQHRNPYGIMKIVKNDFRKGVKAVQNCLGNKVPLSDNRHASRTDIMAVGFAFLTMVILFSSFAHLVFLPVAIISFCWWYYCRMELSKTYYHNGGLWFYTRALALMFVLDLTRFICVIAGTLKTRFTPAISISPAPIHQSA